MDIFSKLTELLDANDATQFEFELANTGITLTDVEKYYLVYRAAKTSDNLRIFQSMVNHGFSMNRVFNVIFRNPKITFDVAKLILDVSGDIPELTDINDEEEDNGLHHMVLKRDKNRQRDVRRIIQLMVEKGYNVDGTDLNNNNILHAIVYNVSSNDIDPVILNKLIDLGASTDRKNSDCQTPLRKYMRNRNNVDAIIIKALRRRTVVKPFKLPKYATPPLFRSFFNGLDQDILFNFENNECSIINEIISHIQSTWCDKYNRQSKTLSKNLAIDSKSVKSSLSAYTMPDIYRYINQYFRTGKSVDDMNAMYMRQNNPKYVLNGFTQQNMLDHVNNIEMYYNSYPGKFEVTTDDVYLLRGADVNSLGLQLNKSILVQGYTSTSTSISIARDFLNNKNGCCMMILHVMPGVIYAPLQYISDVPEQEILLNKNLFFTLRGSIDCRKKQSFIFALVDVTNGVTDFDVDATEKHNYQPQSGICYKISPKLYDDFLSAVQYGLENLDGPVIREICQSLDLNTSGNKYDLIMSIKYKFETSPHPGIDCIPERFETLFCALMGTVNGCLRNDYKHESIIATTSVASTAPTMSSEPGTKRRRVN